MSKFYSFVLILDWVLQLRTFAKESHVFMCIFSATMISDFPRWPKIYNSGSEESVATVGIYQLISLKSKRSLF